MVRTIFAVSTLASWISTTASERRCTRVVPSSALVRADAVRARASPALLALSRAMEANISALRAFSRGLVA